MIGRIYERDIDMLLAEECAVSPGFARALLAGTPLAGRAGDVVDVAVSQTDELGESDLVVTFAAPDGTRFALFIEDKIDAPLQDGQAERYRARAARQVAEGRIAAFAVMIIAPGSWLTPHGDHLAEFDATLTLDAVADLLAATGDARGTWRAALLRNARPRSTATWQRRPHGPTDAFWEAAYAIATDEFPALEMKPVVLTAGSSWVNFRPHDLPTMPRRIYVSLKGNQGIVDLTLSRTAMIRLHPVLAPLLEPGMSLHQTGKSAAIRLLAQPFDPAAGPTTEGLAALRATFAAACRLIGFFRTHRLAITAAIAGAEDEGGR